ncbi:hypothetical protein [Spongiimicrobium sp. 3-5]|uniref:hypothetical protein n=1 Tax=Spongiimicrobium sp. 3-5 TaxID=3332596 RepID=UPI0039801528
MPTEPTRIAIVEVPKSTGLRKSIAGSQEWPNGLKQIGGAIQFEIRNIDLRTKENWFRPMGDLSDYLQ